MLNEERRRAILDLLTRQGRVLVTELSRTFETSQVTIRKDLEILHAHGLVHRTHGGALPAREGALEDPTLREKEKLHRQEKMRIAENAAERVKEGQVIILDSGTTIVFYLWKQAFTLQHAGYASAIAIVLLVMTLGFSIANVRLLDRGEAES